LGKEIRKQAKECYFADRREEAIGLYGRLGGLELSGEEHGYYGDLLH